MDIPQDEEPKRMKKKKELDLFLKSCGEQKFLKNYLPHTVFSHTYVPFSQETSLFILCTSLVNRIRRFWGIFMPLHLFPNLYAYGLRAASAKSKQS